MAKKTKINNSQFGTLTIESDKIITFPLGILGFEELKKYAIVVFEEYGPFQFLVSIEDPETAFPIISPLLVIEKYEPDIKKEDVASIGDFSEKDLIMYVIVTIKKDSKGPTANLKGPIIINQKEKLAQQVIVDSDEYSTNQSFM